jgi:hypothetical protein
MPASPSAHYKTKHIWQQASWVAILNISLVTGVQRNLGLTILLKAPHKTSEYVIMNIVFREGQHYFNSLATYGHQLVEHMLLEDSRLIGSVSDGLCRGLTWTEHLS